MEVYNQFIDPSTCLASLACHFTSKEDQNLIISKGTVLEIFKLIEVEPQDLESEEGNAINDVVAGAESFIGDEIISTLHDKHHKLSLVTEYTLQGRIFEISKFRSNENEDLDYLIICTESAKISIIKWDASVHHIKTVSLHYYEPTLEALLVENIAHVEKRHRTDPNGICTSIELNGIFMILPFYKPDMDGIAFGFEPGDEESAKQSSFIEENIKRDDGENLKKRILANASPSQLKRSKKISDPSFFISGAKLHEGVKNIMDYQFLYSYREPTIAILYAPEGLSWAGYLPKLKDNMKVVVLSLNLDTHKADSIMVLPNLPYDLNSIYPLPSPINGFLLIGSNEILHVNSLGSIKGVYTNKYFPETSDMKLRDESDLNLECEGCSVSFVGDDQVLLISQIGKFYVLSFNESGGISNLNKIIEIPEANYCNVSVNNVLQITNIEDCNSAFLCCQGSDSILLHWNYNVPTRGTVSKSNAGIEKEDEDSWLYHEDETSQTSNRPLTSCTFTKIDKLVNCGPTSDFTIGKVTTKSKVFGLPNPNLNENAIICSSGLEKDTALSIINPSVIPNIRSTLKFSSASKIWTLNDLRDITKYLITTDFKTYKTQVFIVDKKYRDMYSRDFDKEQYSIQFGTIYTGREMLITQVTPYKINMFNFKFKLVDSITCDNEINAASIYDRYAIIITKNGEINIYECNFKTRKLEKLDLPALLNYMIFTYGWITESSILKNISNLSQEPAPNESSKLNPTNFKKEITFWIVTADNRILVFKKNHKEKVYEFKDIHTFPDNLQLTAMNPNYEADVDPLIKQVMFTSIGDSFYSKDYLLILTYGGEVIIYEMYHDFALDTYRLMKSNDIFKFPVIGAPENSYSSATRIERNMFKIEKFNGHSCVMVTGYKAFLILRQHNSVPRLLKFGNIPVLYFAPFNYDTCKNGVIAIDDKKSCRMCQLDNSFDYSNRASIKKIPVGETITKLDYDNKSNTYVVGTMSKIRFLPEDEDGEEIQGVDLNKNHAHNYKARVHLFSPETWTSIDKVELEDNEVCTTLKVMKLNIFETMNDTKNYVIVGSGKYRVEDLATKGSWMVYEIIDVVPDPNHPEAKNRLKLIKSESSRGSILGSCNISGRFSLVQAQRMLVRTIKKDGNAVPVAFTDTSLYTKDVKSFEDMMIIGDAFDGLSLYGFDAEPYRMLKLGKETQNLSLTACDFIVHEGGLYIIAADEDSVLHLLEYDPYDPESMKGLKLLTRSVFRFNGYTTAMRLCDRKNSIFSMLDTLAIPPGADLGFEVIGCNIEGSFYKVTPANEYTYRRLYALQNHISDKESHWLGLNPKMNAVGHLSHIMKLVKRPFIDLNIIKRYISMSEEKKMHITKRLGKNALIETYRDVISLQ
ncbi:hypothetical protein BRETT_000082 [Brettanomyces bruxellensis]|uniref:Cleavage/polyadenylation specificity factor A subunit C-terminal domain-containing protein n=1 Tax=Dekkera bruxellensis TaxID=5007 RepID=A0A871R0D9_DEKBR|nr:uncharacterized protein BRETT_000082 [Brettanomyces bruxellensis]QOU18356.1 hypothetical protein BRETT_000082 [Brettanomyces bruxellensis]